MSVALDFLPSASAPVRSRGAGLGEAPERLASVAVLRPPADGAGSSVRLTRRGVMVLSVALILVGLALTWVARLSAPAAPASHPAGPAVVTVHPGDTLWAIASNVAPDADPVAEVALLQRINHLRTPDLVPGQRLRVR